VRTYLKARTYLKVRSDDQSTSLKVKAKARCSCHGSIGKTKTDSILKGVIVPELPEVETTRRGIYPYLKGQTIKKVLIRNPNLRWPVSNEIYALSDVKVQDITRRGKYILVHLPHGAIMIHLGMSGSLRVLDQAIDAGKHDHMDLILDSGVVIRFNDPRRFGSVLWCNTPQSHPLLANLGPEPLSDAFNAAYMYDLASGRRQSIKSFIMDSHVVVGVGNIYANESLFLAGIHPKRSAGRVSLKRYQVLVEKIKQVLELAICNGGTTLKDFVGSDGKPGYFAQKLHVYGRSGQACTRCKTPLKELRLGQRATVYCGVCQR